MTKREIRKSIASFVLIFLIAFSAFGCITVRADGGKIWKTAEELIAEQGFINGVQMFESYQGSTGNDIGGGGPFGYSADFRPEVWKQFFANSKAMGFQICKFWNNYQMCGIQFDADCRVVGCGSNYLKNLRTIFELAQEQDLYISLTLMSHIESYFPKSWYEKMIRLVHNETYRNLFIQNWVRPVLELSAQYPNVIMVDLYCEPEADGSYWNIARGTSWENMQAFISDLQEAVELYNPRLATYCSATIQPEKISKLYGGIGLDYYSYDNYSSGSVPDPYDLFLDCPLVFGEIGANGVSNTENAVSSYYNAYLNNCINNGIKAAFYWLYHPTRLNAQSLIDDNNTARLRQATWTLRTWASDRINTVNGTPGALDTPAVMYSTGDYIRWFGARGAVSLTLQRSTDKENWSTVVTFNPSSVPSSVTEFHPNMYEYDDSSSLEAGIDYYYRVKATDSSENVTYSLPSYPISK
ncbi:MAG: hypothetical protein J6T73_06035 [Clostridia bacterium]|nr:hypothetical protein [Clostridia bacterium]